MPDTTWPRRLEDGSVLISLHVEGEWQRIRELVELLVAQWVAHEQSVGPTVPEGLTDLPHVESCSSGGADVVFRSRGENTTWYRPIMRFETWMMIHTTGLRAESLEDRVGGESRKPLRISA